MSRALCNVPAMSLNNSPTCSATCIQQAAERDAAFREELLKRCAELASGGTRIQNASASGGSTVVQVSESEDVKRKIGS